MLSMKKINYSDEELLRFITETGDASYFEMLYDRYAPFIYNKCFWFVNDEEEAKDLTQEIFIKIYLNLPKFKGNSKLSTWIYAITVHTSIKFVNKNKNKATFLSEEILHNYFSENIDYNEISDAELLDINYERLQEIMDVLPVEDRNVLLMKYQYNLSINKIVQILNIKESAVKMRLLRAKKKVIEIREKFKSTFKTGQGTKQFN
ncbi:sigma-70 family RNA polymerase sigma factor [Paenimyroides baculatum]|uniref:Sigma-70 family RNA polymerase sigma factor n=2 Tax=Paenimyroides baculatum TaxID=2608000 RepID=A0A5M6CF35_9FLAO|nr:sigma-70 family RNA polymerase sigma factor [Paenimyroides baculatum]